MRSFGVGGGVWVCSASSLNSCAVAADGEKTQAEEKRAGRLGNRGCDIPGTHHGGYRVDDRELEALVSQILAPFIRTLEPVRAVPKPPILLCRRVIENQHLRSCFSESMFLACVTNRPCPEFPTASLAAGWKLSARIRDGVQKISGIFGEAD